MMSVGVSNEVNLIESNFSRWLEVSNLLENDFLRYRTIANFDILSRIDSGYKIIVMGYNSNGSFIKIGEQFAYEVSDLSGFEDLSLLLLFMAQKLDNANAVAPKFEQRPNYFYNKVKTFIESSIDYKKLFE